MCWKSLALANASRSSCCLQGDIRFLAHHLLPSFPLPLCQRPNSFFRSSSRLFGSWWPRRPSSADGRCSSSATAALRHAAARSSDDCASGGIPQRQRACDECSGAVLLVALLVVPASSFHARAGGDAGAAHRRQNVAAGAVPEVNAAGGPEAHRQRAANRSQVRAGASVPVACRRGQEPRRRADRLSPKGARVGSGYSLSGRCALRSRRRFGRGTAVLMCC